MKKDIIFKEDDQIGEETLDVISKADKFNRWMYNTIKPYCHGKVMEIGSGIGNISSYFLEDEYKICLTDIRKNYCEKLNRKFSDNSNFLGTIQMNLTDPDFEINFREELGRYDTIFALNVVEHIEDDLLAIRNCKRLLKNNGNLIILVPAYQALFNSFDVELGHYRRYNKTTLTKLFRSNQLKIVHRQYFNFIGIAGWFYSGKLMNKKQIPESQMSIYNTLVPIFKVIDRLILNKAGLSIIIVGEK